MFLTHHGSFIFSIVCSAWIVGISIVLYLAYRARKKPAGAVPAGEVIFSERGASGFSHKNRFSRVVGAHHFLNLVLNRKELAISLAFPFSLADVAGTLDLHHTIPLARITSITPGTEGKVVIDFMSDAGNGKRLELTLSRGEEFVEKVGCLVTVAPAR